MPILRSGLVLLALSTSAAASPACNVASLSGTWTANFAHVHPGGATTDVVCRIAVDTGGRILWSGCHDGAVGARPFAVSGRFDVSPRCVVSGRLQRDAMVLTVSADVAMNRASVAGYVSGNGWLKNFTAIKISSATR
jgi:hypothetical protein